MLGSVGTKTTGDVRTCVVTDCEHTHEMEIHRRDTHTSETMNGEHAVEIARNYCEIILQVFIEMLY